MQKAKKSGVLISVSLSFIVFLLAYCNIVGSSFPVFYAQTQHAVAGAIHKKNNFTVYVPTTVSKQAQEELRKLTHDPSTTKTPSVDDSNGWKKYRQEAELRSMPLSKESITLFQPTITQTKLGKVPVLDIKPKGWVDNGKVLVYTHGGSYTRNSANSTVGSALLAANGTGLRVISVDYATAPFSKWNKTIDQVISVIQALVKADNKYPLTNIALYGDSAGGGLAAGAVLKMRDKGMGIPAAVVLWSPWADITESGDTYFTLKDADPSLSYNASLRSSAAAYADPKDQKDPYVSPVYANFSKGFPPTLIQGGTKEIFLSGFVRLYQALDQAGIPVNLDIYEGMPHVFQSRFYKIPESHIALSKMNTFLKSHLHY